MRLRDIQRRADRAAAGFDAADFMHRIARDGLIERIEPITVDAGTILDLGTGTGAAVRQLRRRFRRSRIVAVDLSRAMLRRARSRRRWFAASSFLQADATALPLADGCVDVVFANLLLPWIASPPRLFAEVARVLRANGLFAFSTLGPDSLAELRAAWQSVDAGDHVNPFPDMHDIGDAALAAGLRDPVLDADRQTVSYSTAGDLFRDLSAVGARNTLRQRMASMTGRVRFGAMLARLETGRRDGRLHFELELVYGHAFGAGRSAAGDVRIAPAEIGRRRPGRAG